MLNIDSSVPSKTESPVELLKSATRTVFGVRDAAGALSQLRKAKKLTVRATTMTLTLRVIHFHATEGDTSPNRGAILDIRVILRLPPCQSSKSCKISPAL